MNDLYLLDGAPWQPPGGLHRALAYGDGLFETMRLEAGQIALLELHLARLTDSAQRLAIQLNEQVLRKEILQLSQQLQSGMIKILLLRSGERRGYAPEPDAGSHRLLQASASLPVWGGSCSAMLCTTPLGSSPALGGMKHLNRLEQVVAAAELQPAGCDTGIMCLNGDPMCGIDANLVLELNGKLLTPFIRHAGVAGVFRRYMMEQLCPAAGVSLQEQPVTRQMLFEADALYLTNAVRGPRQVVRLQAEGQWLEYGAGDQMSQLIDRMRPQLGVEG